MFSIGKSQNNSDSTEFVSAKDSIKHHEIAICVFSLNSKNENIFAEKNNPVVEILNNILFRYRLSNFSVRTKLGFFKENYFKEYSPKCPSCEYGQSQVENYRISIGTEYNNPKLKIIYPFIDLGYKMRNDIGWIGNFDGVNFDSFTYKRKINGLILETGLGLKAKLYKNLSLLFEFSYNQYFAKANSKEVKSNQKVSNTFDYRFGCTVFRVFFAMGF